eukprot:Transcript_32463.p4 GENE.Transcript_32463~~Transcript_32463.p4  ORF type:complete len:107 (-),score=2.59 Transcript_32463:434-754(-)
MTASVVGAITPAHCVLTGLFASVLASKKRSLALVQSETPAAGATARYFIHPPAGVSQMPPVARALIVACCNYRSASLWGFFGRVYSFERALAELLWKVKQGGTVEV